MLVLFFVAALVRLVRVMATEAEERKIAGTQTAVHPRTAEEAREEAAADSAASVPLGDVPVGAAD